MKHFLKIFSLLFTAAVFFSACDKELKYDKLAFSNNGVATTLTASASAIAAIPADSDKVVVTYTWTDAKYATDSAHQKYIVEIDTAGGNFEKAARKTVYGKLSADFTAKEINAILLEYGFPFNVAQNIIIRLTSSYANNNEIYHSNVLTAQMTPYKVPPKIALPSTGELFIVGGFADPYAWKNEASNFPRGKFAQLSETSYIGIFNFQSSQSYLLLPVNNGNWDNKYGGVGSSNNSNIPAGDDFKPQGSDLSGPATAGSYKVLFDFQSGKYTVTASDIPEFDGLYITGNATAGDWTNDPPANQKFTRLNSVEYELTVALTAGSGRQYKFLVRPTASSGPDWHPQLGSSSSTGGALQYATPGDSPTMDAPAVSGNYKIHVNTYTGLYTISKV